MRPTTAASRVRSKGPNRSTVWAAGTALIALALAGCTAVPSVPVAATAAPSASASVAPVPTASATAVPPCTAAEKADLNSVVRSYPPATDIPAVVSSDPFLREVKRHGRLIVGVSSDTRLFGARNPETNQIEGFDIDLLKAVSQAVLGRVSITYRVITAAERIPLLQDGTVDIVARTMTITCERWKQIAFSAEYYRAGQKVLLPRGSEAAKAPAPIKALTPKSKVCAPKGSTSVERIKQEYATLTPVEVAVHTDCLVLFQQGKVDAITGDDAILAGFAAQDPYAVVPEQKGFSEEPYGLGIAKENRAFVSVVNAVLAQTISTGQWQKSYIANGLAAALNVPPKPPTPAYGRS